MIRPTAKTRIEHRTIKTLGTPQMTLRTLSLLTVAALLLTGCGSGVFVKTITKPDNTPVPRAQTPPVAPFTPNYRASLRNGFYWPKTNLTLYLASPTDAQRASLVEATKLWESYPGSPFKFTFVDKADGADITLTTVYPGFESLALVTAEVEIRRDVAGANLVTLSAHELGHALGIDGHSPEKPDCMNEFAPNPGRITQADANTLASLYSPTRLKSPSQPAPTHRGQGVKVCQTHQN
jgi:hypothetical protein